MSFSDMLTLVAILSAAFFGSVGGVWGLAWWMQKQFSSAKVLVYQKSEEIIKKLEYHEEHDDKRFQEIRDDIWLMRVRNAARDGIADGAKINGTLEKK